MDPKGLIELAKAYQDNREFITNEETAKMALVVPFIRLLGYDPNSPREVRLEYTAEFTQGDGKRLPDRMDFAIFDRTGTRPHMVIETKPLGTDLRAKSQQLARYIAQMADLHFGIITDGCRYLFFGDLENPNQMDSLPFFQFSLDDAKADWAKTAKLLAKFGRESFNADTLVTDAENSRYRQEFIDRLARALRAPGEDEAFLRWLTDGIYRGKRTTAVMERLGEVAREAVEPALLKLMGDDFVERLRTRIHDARSEEGPKAPIEASASEPAPQVAAPADGGEDRKGGRTIETTVEELEFYDIVKQICVRAGHPEASIIYKDTASYFNVSFQRPTRWFARFFTGGRRKSVVTQVPTAEARSLTDGFEIEDAPAALGASRIYIDSPAQLWGLTQLVLRSLELQSSSAGAPEGDESAPKLALVEPGA